MINIEYIPMLLRMSIGDLKRLLKECPEELLEIRGEYLRTRNVELLLDAQRILNELL